MEQVNNPNINNRIELMQVTSHDQEKRDCEIMYDEPTNIISVYAEVKNDGYSRYEPHSADKMYRVESVQNLTYDRPS